MIMYKKKYIQLKERIYFCKGAVNSILIDCNKKKIYQLDREATSLLQALLQGYDLEKLRKTVPQYEEKWLEYLENKELIKYTDVFIESKVLPDKYMQNQLKTVWLELRKACNMKCIHCYNTSNPYADDLAEVLSEADWFNVIKQLQRYNPSSIILIGGEPLLYKGIENIITFIHNNLPSTSIVLYSNLTLLDDVLTEVIVKNDVKVVTSIYSCDNVVHDKITQVVGSYEKTVNNLKKLRQKGVDVRANTVVMSINEKEIVDTVEFIKTLTGHAPKRDVIRCVRDELEYLKPSSEFNTNMISSEECFLGITEERLVKAISGNVCWQGKINITYNGFITPCIMWDKYDTRYNVRDSSLDDVLTNYLFPEFWSVSKDNINICKNCEFRYICRDCRPIAQSLKDRGSNCKYNPYTGKWEK